MQRTLYLFLIIVTAISCNLRNANNNYEFPKQVIISGRILNYNKENSKIRLFIPRLGLEGINIYEDIDSLGQFTAKFDSYTPTDVGIVYKTNFLVLTHPGDSIYIEFDGKAQQRVELLTSIKFSGDAAIQNQKVAKFQSMFYSNPIFYDRETINSAVKELEMNEYITYLDSQQNIRSKLYDQFIAEVNPNTETKIWAKTLLDQDYYDDLGFYPVDHKSYNNLTNEEWSIPISYYDNLKKRLPITKSMLISNSALSRFINRYHYDYVYNNIWEEEENQIYKRNDGNIGGPGDILDSIHVYGIIKHTPDELLKQMVLTELIAQNFEKSDIHLFEQYRHVIESNITEPFLIKPLLQKYNEIKGHLENPEIRSDAVLNKIGNS